MKAIFCEKRMGKNQLEKGEAIAHAPELFWISASKSASQSYNKTISGQERRRQSDRERDNTV